MGHLYHGYVSHNEMVSFSLNAPSRVQSVFPLVRVSGFFWADVGLRLDVGSVGSWRSEKAMLAG
jgi:hypothetical protein